MKSLQSRPDMKSAERLLDVYKALYNFEVERGEKITSRTTIVLGLYSVLFGQVAFILNDFPRVPDMWSWRIVLPYILFWLLLGVELYGLGNAIRWTRKFIFAGAGNSIDPVELHKDMFPPEMHMGQMTPYMTDPVVISYLLDKYIRATIDNFVENANKNAYYISTIQWQIGAALVACFCLLFYFIVKFNENDIRDVPSPDYRYTEVISCWHISKISGTDGTREEGWLPATMRTTNIRMFATWDCPIAAS